MSAISEVTLYLEEDGERVGEVSLFAPLEKRARFDEENPSVRARNWRFTKEIPFHRRFLLKIQHFLFQHFPSKIPAERLTPEAKLKSVVAILLAQESLREFFLGNKERRRSFMHALEHVAKGMGGVALPKPRTDDPYQFAQELTELKGRSLVKDLPELNLQMAALPLAERNEILYALLNTIERAPLTSVLEVVSSGEAVRVRIETTYAKTHIQRIEPTTGEIVYTFQRNQATASVPTKANSLPGARGVINQRIVREISDAPQFVGAYSGELTHPNHVLEQLLFLFGEGQKCHLLHKGAPTEEKRILFTSLFSWNELDKIVAQHDSIDMLHGKLLHFPEQGRTIGLSLYHRNIPFNALTKLPTPAETKGKLTDMGDETLASLAYLACVQLGYTAPPLLKELAEEIDTLRQEHDFVARQKGLLDKIDQFRKLKPKLAEMIPELHPLLTSKTSHMDSLLYTDLLARKLGLLQNKNCARSIDRSAGANAADKAQTVFSKLQGKPFLPHEASEEETALFKVLYSMYLVWEEPEIGAGLSTGFTGEKFRSFLLKNPETTRYLIKWLKRHPEIYLGLSDYR